MSVADFSGLSILFAGSGAFGLPSLQRLRDRGANVVRVFTQPDKPAGRGHKLTPTPVGQFAIEQHLDLVRTDDINAEELPPADLLVVIAFGQKIAPHVVDHARLGAINLHASRLPRYRGAAPINRAVINGETETGNSVIRLAQTMDAGAVLGMSRVPIKPLDTAGDVHDRLSLDGADLIERVVADLAAGRAKEIEQDHTLATRAPKLSRDEAKIDFSADASAVANRIRGMFPWPGCRVRLLDDQTEIARLTLVVGRPIESESPGVPGVIRADGTIACGRGAFELLELQPEGKRRMSLADFRAGRPWRQGFRLESIS